MNPKPIEDFIALSEAEHIDIIQKAKAALGDRVVILGHHYQRDEVFQFSDITGDSLKLSREASNRGEADFIVFCGVHFMAETADILCQPHQQVILPDLSAGCSMADMADAPQVEQCWSELDAILGGADGKVIPVTYINSSAELKAFCGRHGGIVCTSSNARKILEWAWARGRTVLFFPDEHLGRNTAHRMGVADAAMHVWDPFQVKGGLSDAAIQGAKILLWKGYCSVHQMFQPAHVAMWRQRIAGVKVIAHPECCQAVCDLADEVGSTEMMIQAVKNSPPGSKWVVGTELNLVNRLAAQNPDKEIHFMSPTICMCSTMFRIDPAHLAWTLANLVDGVVVNRITVPEPQKAEARLSLQRMLEAS
ncbi:MAG: quinolinate synthase [Alphaproteobacteria bacterium CG_4_10_14_0_2_um_filter_63_37]|nr:MAG: quinolinate synthetase [Proteobacteria bacterium CG1_02_64_396]PJA24799.1 MAG: quinolinate synthase [Alphaproteobacteria bacterium CG_4_10_14_0_2_um_filter_63_37]